jgi:hypothetical protein
MATRGAAGFTKDRELAELHGQIDGLLEDNLRLSEVASDLQARLDAGAPRFDGRGPTNGGGNSGASLWSNPEIRMGICMCAFAFRFIPSGVHYLPINVHGMAVLYLLALGIVWWSIAAIREFGWVGWCGYMCAFLVPIYMAEIVFHRGMFDPTTWAHRREWSGGFMYVYGGMWAAGILWIVVGALRHEKRFGF